MAEQLLSVGIFGFPRVFPRQSGETGDALEDQATTVCSSVESDFPFGGFLVALTHCRVGRSRHALAVWIV